MNFAEKCATLFIDAIQTYLGGGQWKTHRFILIDESVLPEVYQKVIRVNQLLETGEASNTSEAVKMAASPAVYIISIKTPFFRIQKRKRAPL